MNSRDPLARPRDLALPPFTTSAAAAALPHSVQSASQSLRRLAASGLAISVRRALWTLGPKPDPLALGEYVTAPHPSYVSLQTALYLHGMVSQIPAVTYLVSLGRSGRVTTRIGTYSLHHVVPEFFDGFEHHVDSASKIATPEKALVDFLYLSPTRARLFAALPELVLPRSFRPGVARGWARRVPSQRLRTRREKAGSPPPNCTVPGRHVLKASGEARGRARVGVADFRFPSPPARLSTWRGTRAPTGSVGCNRDHGESR